MREGGLDDVVAAAARGDGDALASLYRRFQPSVLGFLTSLAPGHEEDLAAETWIDAAGALPGLATEDDFRRLLFTIARRRAIDHGRKLRRRRTAPADLTLLPDQPAAPDVAESVVDGDSAARAIRRITELLPAAQAEVIVLRVVAGLSVPEVAAVIGRSAATVSVLQSRGLRRLAEQLGRRTELDEVVRLRSV